MNLEAVKEFKDILSKRVLIYDGAMGTKLIAKGLTSQSYGGKDGCSEALNLYSPEIVKQVHKDYIEAGCDVIETNTFGGTRITLKEYGLENKVREINLAAVKIAKDAIAEAANGRRIFIAASVGPTSQLPSLGAIAFDDMAEAYAEQFEALFDAGVDILQIETCQDLLQIKCALYAAQNIFEKRNWRCPVVVSVTLESNGKMLVGTDLSAVAVALEPYEIVDMLGLNCSTGPMEMVRHVAHLSECWSRYIGVMPNAGLPDLVDGKPVYNMTPEEFASYHVKFAKEYGANMAGGCCGTNEGHLKAVVEALKDVKPIERKISEKTMAASMFSAVDMRQIPAPTLIGERTNTNGAKKFREYLANEDFDGMTAMGKEQVKNGAHLVDLCVAFAGRNEVEDLKRLVPMFALQVNLPLVIDSTSPEAIETALKLHGGRCVVNSVNFEDGGERLYKIAKIAKKFGALLICLTIDEEGMAKTAEKKFAIAKRLKNVLCDELGFKESDLIIDPLTFTVAGDAESRNAAVETLKALKLITENMPQANTILGLSNVSFGLKASSREVLNSIFVVEAVKNGLKTAIINPAKIIPVNKIPEDIKELALNLIYNKHDDGSDLMNYIKALDGKGMSVAKKDNAILPLDEQLKAKVVESDGSGLQEIIDQLVKTTTAEDIVNNIILPAMKEVGDLFGAGTLQLPFVLQSAEIVKKSVDLLKPYMKKNDGKSENKFILATVAGDVHDIGKNLVNIMVSNNGFEVIDLGIRVDIDTMIKAAQENKSDVIGMSGLLVRSTVIMKENLEELNRRNFLPDVILGGAALTEDYVEKELKPIYKGRVYYAADAIDAAKILMKIAEEKKTCLGELQNNQVRKKRVLPVPTNEVAGNANRYQFTKDSELLELPFMGLKEIDIETGNLFTLLSHKVVFEARWGYKKGNLTDEEYKATIEGSAVPLLSELIDKIQKEKLIQTHGVYGLFRCQANGENICLLDEAGLNIAEFEFPRQKKTPYLCLSDFVSDDGNDYIAVWSVTIGKKFCEETKKLYEAGNYRDYHLLHGLGAELADCGAVWLHRHIHRELFPYKLLTESKPCGCRYSFGYPSCPDLNNQKELIRLLGGETKTGIQLTENCMMVPELSVAGFILFNKNARYFVV